MALSKREHDLLAAVKESFIAVEKMGYMVLFVGNYGSHNYNLDINNEFYNSDIDTKAIILPTLNELISNSTPVSTTIDISCGQCDIKDIRVFMQTLVKANIQFLELLRAKAVLVNAKYYDEFKWFIEHLDELIEGSKPQLLKSTYGMSMEKKKALCHPYPTIKWKIDKWGYDGKQLHHIIRLKDFISNYFYNNKSFQDAIQYDVSDVRHAILMDAKLNRYDLQKAKDMADFYCHTIKEWVDELLPTFVENKEIKQQYLDKANEIIKKAIIENVKKEEANESNRDSWARRVWKNYFIKFYKRSARKKTL